MIRYLNIIGIAVVAAFLITLGLHLIFPKLKLFNKKTFCGISLVLIALLLIVQKLTSAGFIH
jgi:hypothetical protein